MKCIECKNLDLQRDKTYARIGFGKCTKDKEIGRMVGVFCDSDCDLFAVTDNKTIESRIEWRDKRFSMKGSHAD